MINWETELEKLKEANLERTLKVTTGLDFCSNDYLSLAGHKGIRAELIKALKNNIPLSAGASRLLRGQTPWHEETETLFRKWVGRESALFFSSGYLCNIGVISTFQDYTLFSDELNHASLIDGCRLSRNPCYIYPHKDLNKLEIYLKKTKEGKKMIITESLFSMDGDIAPLKEISELALKYKALLLVDEAHATGIFGKNGGGFLTLLKEKEHIISIHPCGKALSSNGAFVVGPKLLKKYLIHKCRPFIYTTAPYPLLLLQIKSVLNTLKKEPNRMELLKKKALYFRKKISYGESESPIVSVVLGSAGRVLSGGRELQKRGFDVGAIRYPTVPKKTERLRICLHYNHTYKQLDSLAQSLKKL